MILNLFPTKIYKIKLSIDLEKLSKSMESLWENHANEIKNNNYGSMRNDSMCTYNVIDKLHEHIDLRDFVNEMELHIKKYWESLNYRGKPMLFQMWSNLYNTGSYIDSHCHSPVIVTSNFYVKKPVDSSNIFFQDPNEMVLKYQPVPFEFRNYPFLFEQEIEVEAGDLVIFPGYLKHRTNPSQSSDSRITITSNYLCN